MNTPRKKPEFIVLATGENQKQEFKHAKYICEITNEARFYYKFYNSICLFTEHFKNFETFKN